MPSPGEQAPPQSPNVRRIASVLAVIALFSCLLFVYREHLEEYRLYFFTERQPVVFRYAELSGDWTEQSLQDRFKGFKVRCFSETGNSLGDRVCGLDAKSHNGVPVLFISFFFSNGRLAHASINVPWWSHSEGRRVIEAALGPPLAAQWLPNSSGVRLLGWKLPDGAALFYNRDKDSNPLVWNAIFWNSATACKSKGCFTN